MVNKFFCYLTECSMIHGDNTFVCGNSYEEIVNIYTLCLCFAKD